MGKNNFCERTKYYIEQPINSITSIAFLFTCYFLWKLIETQKIEKIQHTEFYIHIILLGLLTITTFGMHATQDSSIWGKLDISTMFLIIVYSLLLNLKIIPFTSISISILLTLLLNYFPKLLNLTTFGIITTMWILSYLPYFNNRVFLGYLWFLIAIILWLLDRYKIVCWSKSPFQLHSFWHIFSAIGFYYLFTYNVPI